MMKGRSKDWLKNKPYKGRSLLLSLVIIAVASIAIFSIHQVLATPIIYMQDTTASFGLPTYSGRSINAEIIDSNSALIGAPIDSITIKLKKAGNPTGSATVGIFYQDGTVKKTFGIIQDVSALPTTFTDFTYSLPSGTTYTIEAPGTDKDRIGIQYSGGDSANNIAIMSDQDTNNPFDGQNTYAGSLFNGWTYYSDLDFYMTLQLMNPPPSIQFFLNTFELKDLTGNNIRLHIDNTGNIGIGTTTPAKKLDVAGSVGVQGLNVYQITKTSAYTLSSTDDTVIGDSTTAAFTFTLPAAVSMPGKIFEIKKKDSSLNAITITASPQTIDGLTSVGLIHQYDFLVVESDGTNWQVLAGNTFNSNVNIGGNIVSTAPSGSTLKIIPSTNGLVCIGSGC